MEEDQEDPGQIKITNPGEGMYPRNGSVEILPGEITEVSFSLLSEEEIDNIAVVKVTNKDDNGNGSVRDPRMGPTKRGQICDTCSNTMEGCLGHYGKIEIPHLMHPLSIKNIISILSSVCNDCGGLLITEEEIQEEGINRLTKEKRLSAIGELARRNDSCSKYSNIEGVKQCQPNPIYHNKKDDKNNPYITYSYSKTGKKYKLFPYQEEGKSIYKILNAISNEDAKILGFTGSHPRNMIISRIVVIPWCARPDTFQLGRNHADFLTYIYQDIVGCVATYKKASSKTFNKEQALKDIYWKVIRYIKNDGKYTQGGNKVVKGLSKRIQGKEAIIRQIIMGKKVNFAGRTVIGPAAYLRPDQIGIPALLAHKLTRPIIVNKMNHAELQSKLDSDKITHITMKNSIRQVINDTFWQRFPEYTLKMGDRVERMLQDGDVVIYNRQPSLHKHSILAGYAKIIDEKIVRMNLSTVIPLNADFDGDEVSIHIPQTVEAYAEIEQLLHVSNNLLTSETNSPSMGLNYDTLSGVYLLTQPQHEYMKGNLTKDQILIDPDVFDRCIDVVKDMPQMATLKKRLSSYNVDWNTGYALISSTLPEDFDYENTITIADEKVYIQIINGIMTQGILNKSVVGTKDRGVITEMVHQLGGEETINFMAGIQFITREYLQQRGLSVGVDDCVPLNPQFNEDLKETLDSATMKVISLAKDPSNKIMQENQERNIVNTLEEAKMKSENLVRKYYKEDNALLIMSNSGAKGTMYNAARMGSILGLQKVKNQRIPANLRGNRSLPIFEPNSKDPESRGFCKNSYSSGLNPAEYFFHAQEGREGITDTAINTSTTGHLQHQMIKTAEDVHINTSGAVCTSGEGVVNPIYGEDGFDATSLTEIKILGNNVPFIRNMKQLANKINRKYG